MKRRTFFQSVAGWLLAAKFSCLWPGFADVQVAPLNDQVLALLEPDTVFISSRSLTSEQKERLFRRPDGRYRGWPSWAIETD